MIRIFASPSVSETSLQFSEDFHHLINVLRLKEDDTLEIVTPDLMLYLVRIVSASEKKQLITAEILDSESLRCSMSGLSAGVSLVKKGFEEMTDSLSQLNIDQLIPFISERTVVRPDIDRFSHQHKRLQEIAREAAKQSRGRKVMQISRLSFFADVLNKNADIKLLFTACEGLTSDLTSIPVSSDQSVFMLTGPEGDFTAEEVTAAVQAGFMPVILRGNILRTGNAAVTAAAVILHKKGLL